jgi:hypothetical protein
MTKTHVDKPVPGIIAILYTPDFREKYPESRITVLTVKRVKGLFCALQITDFPKSIRLFAALSPAVKYTLIFQNQALKT